ncbi:MAG: hypothetical protein MJY64_03875 [archaeon]|nr:hypothetical protein [archaeon]
MSSIVYLKNKVSGKKYAYLNESIWDSEKGRCRCIRKCLGHVDPVTGDIVPNRKGLVRESATVTSVGATFFLRNVSDSIGLTNVLKETFDGDWDLFISIVFYIIIEGNSLSKIKYWSIDNDIPYKGVINVEDVVRILGKIDENTLFRFFRGWRDFFKRDDFYTVYISPVTSYDKKVETIRFNDLPLIFVDQVTNLSITFDASTSMPISYIVNATKPCDSTEIRRIEMSESWLDFVKPIKILESGYYTEDRFSDLLKSNHRFIIQIPTESALARSNINRVKDRVMDLRYCTIIDGETFFVMSFLNYLEGKKCYMHIYFSTSDAEKEFSLFLDLINDCKNELLQNICIPEHKEFYKKYFIVKEYPHGRSVEENGEAIMSYNTVAGFVMLLSNTVKNADVALKRYLNKGRTQHNFENLKNEKDLRKFKLDYEANYYGRVFMQFVALILFTEIDRRIKKHMVIREMSFTDVIREMETFKKISIPGFHSPFFTNINDTQSRILKVFGIDIKNLK